MFTRKTLVAEKLKKVLVHLKKTLPATGELSTKEKDLCSKEINIQRCKARALGREQSLLPAVEGGAFLKEASSVGPQEHAGAHRKKKSRCKGPEPQNGWLASGTPGVGFLEYMINEVGVAAVAPNSHQR